MSDFTTVATFESAIDAQFLLAKSILEENGIEYYATNENYRTLNPPIGFIPSNMCIESRVPVDQRDEVMRLLKQFR
jgi:hypothetical protein